MTGSTIGGTIGTGIAMALAPETGGLSMLAVPALGGAAGSALGGALTGSKNIWKDALLGGIGGGAAGGLGGLMGGGMGGLFDPATSAAANVGADAATSPTLAAGSMLPGAASPSLFSSANLMKALPFAAAGGASLLDSATRPKQVGPIPQSHPVNPGQVAPLSRQYQSVDPNSYLSASNVNDRSFYAPYSMQPSFLAKGGMVRSKGGLGGGLIASQANTAPTPYPVMGKKKGVVRYYADGGSSNASSSNIPMGGIGMVSGKGDGKSDSIPAMLSDGEFVMSAPAVSALGNGSNNAGAKKLSMMQKNILHKHYKGGAMRKSGGISSYVH